MAINITRLHCLLLIITGITLHGKAQIINIERARMQSDSTGWLGNAGTTFSLTKNTRQLFSADADIQFQYRNDKNLYLLAGQYNMLKASGSNLINNGLIHLRYNYRFNRTVRWEAFSQWQRNTIMQIEYRFLVGSGPRFKLMGREKARIYAGCLFMYEWEKEMNATHRLHSDLRNSSYLSFTVLPSSTIEIVSTTYFQPLINNWSDNRLMNQFLFRLQAGKHWAVRLNWTYMYDSNPVPGTPAENYNLSTGFDIDL